MTVYKLHSRFRRLTRNSIPLILPGFQASGQTGRFGSVFGMRKGITDLKMDIHLQTKGLMNSYSFLKGVALTKPARHGYGELLIGLLLVLWGHLPLSAQQSNERLMDVYAAKGQAIAKADPLLRAIRAAQPEGDYRMGFDIGLGVWTNHTADGPGKQKILESLPVELQVGFRAAAEVARQRNSNAELAATGERIVLASPSLAAVRAREPAGTYWLGFAIATAIFGDPALGALGNTLTGPGSEKIRSSLDGDGQRGFDAAVKLLLDR